MSHMENSPHDSQPEEVEPKSGEPLASIFSSISEEQERLEKVQTAELDEFTDQDSVGLSKKKIHLGNLVRKSLGGTVGGPIFVILGTVILRAGTGSLISLIINGILMIAFVMVFSELALSLPISGGGYSFSKEAMGGLQSFIVGWLIWVGNLLFTALSGLGFAYSLEVFFPEIDISPFWIKGVGILIILVFTYLNIRIPRKMSRIMIWATMILVVLFISFIVLGLVIGSKNNSSFSTAQFSHPINLNGTISMIGYTFVFFCVYEWNSTFESLTVEYDQIKKPRKSIPRAFLLSIMIAGLIYWSVTLVTLLNLGDTGSPIWNELTASDAPLAVILGHIMGPIGIGLMGLAGIIATITSINSGLQMSAHVIDSLARDGFAPKKVRGSLKGVKWRTMVISAGIASFMLFFMDVGLITETSNIIFIISMIVLGFSLIRLRKSRIELIRPWKVPFYPYLPMFTIFGAIILLLYNFFFADGLLGVVAGILTIVIGILYYLFLTAQKDRLSLNLDGSRLGLLTISAIGVILLQITFYISPENREFPLLMVLFWGGWGLLLFETILGFVSVRNLLFPFFRRQIGADSVASLTILPPKLQRVVQTTDQIGFISTLVGSALWLILFLCLLPADTFLIYARYVTDFSHSDATLQLRPTVQTFLLVSIVLFIIASLFRKSRHLQ